MDDRAENKFFYVIESQENSVFHRLDVEITDVIQNADGEVDCPLDRVLRKHQLEIKDLFEMKVDQVKFVLQSNTRETVLQSISFKNLTFQS